MGFSAWAELYSKEDAVVVEALRNAGAIVYCKTTLPLVGMVGLYPLTIPEIHLTLLNRCWKPPPAFSVAPLTLTILACPVAGLLVEKER